MVIAALAVMAGNAVVQAMVTDGWEGVRRKIAAVFGRGEPDPRVEQRLDAARAELTAAGPAELEQVRAGLAAQWQARFADLLADYPDVEAELDALVAEITVGVRGTSDHSAAAGRDMRMVADRGGVAAGVIHGSVSTGPTSPGPAIS